MIKRRKNRKSKRNPLDRDRAFGVSALLQRDGAPSRSVPELSDHPGCNIGVPPQRHGSTDAEVDGGVVGGQLENLSSGIARGDVDPPPMQFDDEPNVNWTTENRESPSPRSFHDDANQNPSADHRQFSPASYSDPECDEVYLDTNPDGCNNGDTLQDDEVDGGNDVVDKNGDNTDHVHRSVEEDITAAQDVLRSVKIWFSYGKMVAYMSMYGEVQMSVQEYKFMSSVMRYASDERRIPAVATARQHMYPFLRENVFAKSSIRSYKVQANRKDPCSGTVEKKARVVLPSTWAAMDVACPHLSAEMFCSDEFCGCQRHDFGNVERKIEHARVVRDRSENTGRSSVFWVERAGVPFETQDGDVVRFYSPGLGDGSTTARDIIRHAPFRKAKRGGICCDMMVVRVLSVEVAEGSLGNTAQLRGDCEGLSQHETDLISTLERYIRRSQVALGQRLNSESQLFYLLPGDTCTILHPVSTVGDGSLYVVFISRFWRGNNAKQARLAVWFYMGRGQHGHSPSYVTTPTCVPELRKAVPRSAGTRYGKCLTRGKLPDGERFYVYRVLLYTDDFNSRGGLVQSTSVGGFYLMPIGLNLRSRVSCLSVHVITLTPPGLKTNFVMDDVIDDLTMCATQGIQAVDVDGLLCRVFIEVIGYVGDYQASSAVVDVMAVGALAPCTVCSFMLNSLRVGARGSRFAFTVHVHSAHSSFSRSLQRQLALRRSGLSEDEFRFLGMNDGTDNDILQPGLWPFTKLCLRLQSIGSGDNDVASMVDVLRDVRKLDPYVNNIVAPDHLLTGLMANVLDCCFSDIGDQQTCMELSRRICVGLRRVGVHGETAIYNPATKAAHNMQMSVKYCVFSFLPFVLRAMNLTSLVRCTALVDGLHDIAALAFWWPTVEVDGIHAVDFVHGNGQAAYHNEVLRLVKNYLSEVHRLCEGDGGLRRYLDKPNVHRLMEFAIHTLPRYSHALMVTELVFESSHQQLKSTLKKNTLSSAHISAVEKVIARDWLHRVGRLAFRFMQDDGAQQDRAGIGLIRLLGGARADRVNWKGDHVEHIRSELAAHLRTIFCDAVYENLENWYGQKDDADSDIGKWRVPAGSMSMIHEGGVDGWSIRRDIERVFLDDVETVTGRKAPMPVSKLTFTRTKGGRPLVGYKQHVLEVGDTVQVLVTPERINKRVVDVSTDGLGTRQFYRIEALCGWQNDDPWAAMARYHRISDGPCPVYKLEDVSASKYVTTSQLDAIGLESALLLEH